MTDIYQGLIHRSLQQVKILEGEKEIATRLVPRMVEDIDDWIGLFKQVISFFENEISQEATDIVYNTSDSKQLFSSTYSYRFILSDDEPDKYFTVIMNEFSRDLIRIKSRNNIAMSQYCGNLNDSMKRIDVIQQCAKAYDESIKEKNQPKEAIAWVNPVLIASTILGVGALVAYFVKE